jgi:hypothetical protein
VPLVVNQAQRKPKVAIRSKAQITEVVETDTIQGEVQALLDQATCLQALSIKEVVAKGGAPRDLLIARSNIFQPTIVTDHQIEAIKMKISRVAPSNLYKTLEHHNSSKCHLRYR